MSWRLPSDEGDGLKTVYIQFKDLAGNISKTYQKDITLDRSLDTQTTVQLDTTQSFVHITDGIKYMNNYVQRVLVTLSNYSEDVRYIKINHHPSFYKSFWQIFRPKVYYSLQNNAQGIHSIYLTTRDKAQNTSHYTTDFFILDTVPPYGCDFYINARELSTNELDVELSMFSADARKVYIGDAPDKLKEFDFHGPSEKKTWKLRGQDGEKGILMQFEDPAGNKSKIISRSIVYDSQAPQYPDFVLAGGRKKVTDPNITLEAKADGASLMQISESKDFYKAVWRGYTTQLIDIRLSEGYGDKTVYMRFMDIAFNVSESISKTILFEQIPIRCGFSIDGNRGFTNKPNREVRLDIRGRFVEQMMISQSPNFSDASWEDYQTTKTLQLKEQDGVRYVYMRFRSSTGTEPNPRVFKQSILLDRVPPANGAFIPKLKRYDYLNPTVVEYQLSKGANYSGDAIKYQVSAFEDFRNAKWLVYTERLAHIKVRQGQDKLYFRFKDVHENVTPPIKKRIPYSTKSVNIQQSVIVNKGGNMITDPEVELNIQAPEMKQMRIWDKSISLDEAKWLDVKNKLSWYFPDKEGQNTLFVQFRDEQQAVYMPVVKDIILDRQPPIISRMSIEEGKYCNTKSRKIHLLLRIEGGKYVGIAEESVKDMIWLKHRPRMPYILSSGDGQKILYVQAIDEAGNRSKLMILEVTLDTEIATEDFALSINSDDVYTNRREVNLDIRLQDEYHEMILSSDSLFSPPAHWEAVSTKKRFVLGYEDGKYTIYIKFRDGAGNETSYTSDEIILDTEAPIPHYVQINKGATATEDRRIILFMEVDGAYSMRLNDAPELVKQAWEPYLPKRNWEITGYRKQILIHSVQR